MLSLYIAHVTTITTTTTTTTTTASPPPLAAATTGSPAWDFLFRIHFHLFLNCRSSSCFLLRCLFGILVLSLMCRCSNNRDSYSFILGCIYYDACSHFFLYIHFTHPLTGLENLISSKWIGFVFLTYFAPQLTSFARIMCFICTP
jgi:hypothetical protein